jgi:hypothetical protein
MTRRVRYLHDRLMLAVAIALAIKRCVPLFVEMNAQLKFNSN